MIPAFRDPSGAIPGPKPRELSLNIARRLMDPHLRRLSTKSSRTFTSEMAGEGCSPSQQNDSPVSSTTSDGKDALAQEGLLAIIMDVCKLYVTDALHDVHGPVKPARRSTVGTKPAWERKPSYLDLGSEDDDEVPESSAPRNFNTDTSDWEKVRTPQHLALPPGKSQEQDDQWATEKEQTRTHISEIIRSHVSRHMYLIRLCRALMLYGAPTHRLEE